METAISIPDRLSDAADRLALRLGISRNELYQRAVATFVEHHDGDGITAQLDSVYGSDPDLGRLDAALEHLQRASIENEEW